MPMEATTPVAGRRLRMQNVVEEQCESEAVVPTTRNSPAQTDAPTGWSLSLGGDLDLPVTPRQ